ncbi:MAG: phage tail protein I [Chloroflexi bacterium]|nr:phage tail protein I [Chloroflexota bacterium]
MANSIGKIILTSPDEPEREYIIATPIVRVGRAPEPQNDLVLNHSWVSRAHLRIYCDRLPVRVQDMRSSNGTALNDIPLPADEIREMKNGDVLSIGPFRLRLALTPEQPVEQAPAQPAPAAVEEMRTRVDSERALAALRLLQTPKAPAPPPPEAPQELQVAERPPERWVGVPDTASRWLQYLPPIYAEDEFLGRFLLIFEDMLGPLEQIINHFDLFLDPSTAPEPFLPWLDRWLAGIMDERWPAPVKRDLLRRASWLYQMRGTRVALEYQLRVCSGCQVEIQENIDGAHTFYVIVQQQDNPVDLRLIERIIDLNRPAHTTYQVKVSSVT